MIDLEKVVLQQCLRHFLTGGRSENPGGGGSDYMVGIGLTDLPKYGGKSVPPSCPSLFRRLLFPICHLKKNVINSYVDS